MPYERTIWRTKDIVTTSRMNHIENGIETAGEDKFVRYDVVQTLTEAQKLQSRENIGAADDADVSELKSAVDYVATGEMTLDLEDHHDTQTSCTVKSDNTVTRSGSRYVSAQVPIDETWYALTITANSAKNSYVTFVTELIPVAPTTGDSIASILATGETGRHTITAGTEDTLTIPADAAYAVISLTDNANDMTPSAVAACTKTRKDIIDTNKTLGTALKFMGVLTNSDDLDNVTETGWYYWTSSSIPAHRPIATQGKLLVFKRASTDIHQVCLSQTSDLYMHVRGKNNAGWHPESGWERISFNSYVDSRINSLSESMAIMDNYIADKLMYEFDGYVQANVRTTGTKIGTLAASEYHIVNSELIKTDHIYEIEAGEKTIQFYNYDADQQYIGSETTGKKHFGAEDISGYIEDNPTAAYIRVRFGTSEDPVSIDEESENYYKTCGIFMKVFYDFTGENSRGGSSDDESDKSSANGVPNYYFEDGYLKDKIDSIMTIRDAMGVNSDSFFFVTDYHVNSNAGHTPALIRYIAARTGIEKLFSAGDNGRQTPPTNSAGEFTQYNATQESACALDELERQVRYAFSSTGNHEWNRGGANDGCVALTRAGVLGFYIDRYKLSVSGADVGSGCYYVDNTVNKIRYYFLNQTSGCVVIKGGRQWFAESLETIPDGYAVAVIMHHGYIPAAATNAEYDTEISSQGASHLSSHWIQHILDAFQNHTTYEVTGTETDQDTGATVTVAESYDFTSTNGSVIGVFCGHYHHGSIYEKWQETRGTDTDHVMVFRGGTDTLKAASIAMEDESGAKLPWYWQDGIIGGTKIMREKNTINEQCFYAIQIDLTNKIVHITPIGGDHDYAPTSIGDTEPAGTDNGGA